LLAALMRFSSEIIATLFVSVSSLTLVASCVGLAAGTYGTKELAREHFSLRNERNQFGFEQREQPYSREEVVLLWGEADVVESHEKCEVLVYENGTAWAGVGAFIGFVPIPAMVPTGKYKNRIYLVNGETRGLIQEYGEADRGVGYICGSNDCATLYGQELNEARIDGEDALREWCESFH
jgi:hypothetical protein